jgi:hypothetical protein
VGAREAAARFHRWLQDTDRRWLVVFDDLARPGGLGGWWPPANPRGRTIVTTRRRDSILQDHGELVDVGVFTPGQAHAYLREMLPGRRLEQAGELAADLGHLLLALAQAAVYIRDYDLTCAVYRRRLAERSKLVELLPGDDALPDGQRVNVTAALLLSMDAADRLKPVRLAWPVLALPGESPGSGSGLLAAVVTHVAPALSYSGGVKPARRA